MVAVALGKSIAQAIDDFGPDFDKEGNPLEEGESDRIKDPSQRDDSDGGAPEATDEREEAGATA